MYKKILIPIDLDQESSWQRALPVVRELISAFGAQPHAMTVLPALRTGFVGSYFPADFEEKAHADAYRRLQELIRDQMPGMEVECHVGLGAIYREIIDQAEQISADLIVMASHRPELKDYLIGPNAANVVRHAPMSVLVVRD